MEEIIYYSRNAKKPPYVVTIRIDGDLTYINCDCPLGVDKKICRHKINAIRGDKRKSHDSTSDKVISRLRHLFMLGSTLRSHLEKEWEELRIFSYENKDKVDEIENKRRILGEAFAHGFLNITDAPYRKEFNLVEWEDVTEVYVSNLNCKLSLKYKGYDGDVTSREVLAEEIFVNNFTFYLRGYCYLRKETRTFRFDRILTLSFGDDCNSADKKTLLDVFARHGLVIEP